MKLNWRLVGRDVWLWELSLVAWGLLASYLLSAHGHLDWTGHALGRDFVNYWTAGHLVAEGRIADIFNPNLFLGQEHRLFDPRLPFHFWSYPPPALFLVSPLALTGYMPGLFLWSLAGLIALYPALRAWTALGPTPTRWLWLWLILLCPAVATNIALGQNGAFTAALLIGGIALMDRRPMWAGVLFGLLIFKPQIGLLIPVAVLAGRHWKVFLAAAVAGCLVLTLSALVYGLDAWRGFLGPTLHMQTLMLRQGRGPFQWMMPSAFMAARGLGVTWTWAMAIQAPFTLAAIALVWRTWARPNVSLQLKGAVLMMATFVASPQAFNYDLVPAAAAALLIWRRDKVVGQGLAVAVWALPVLMIALQAVHIVVTPIVLTWAMIELARQAWPRRATVGFATA
jgi:hypothetical protein